MGKKCWRSGYPEVSWCDGVCVCGGGGAVVLWGENFSLVNFCLVEWGSFVEEGEGREGLTVEKPSFYFAPRGSVAFEGFEGGEEAGFSGGKGMGIWVEGREREMFSKGSALLSPEVPRWPTCSLV